MTADIEDELGGNDAVSDEDLDLIYGSRPRTEKEIVEANKPKTIFRPWHHPVKQIVRDRQWAALTRRMIEEREKPSSSLRYFTLPGPDLLDVRVLAEVCAPLEIRLEYFGFDLSQASAADGDGRQHQGEWINAESALRQSGRIAEDALILPDRLEDLAIENSQASAQLRQRPTFDIINIDACDHLAYLPAGRTHNTFDALVALLKHQMTSRTEWLLFVTTRAQPDLLGNPGVRFQTAITQNLMMSSDFGAALAASLEVDSLKLATSLTSVWGEHGANFLKLYSIGLGKFLLQFFHMQPNLPANVEMASCYAYRVHDSEPDMLAVAFRITPDPPRVFSPGTGGAAVVKDLEASRAIKIVSQAQKLQDLDYALASEEDVREEAVTGTAALLSAAAYDLAAWRSWLAGHERRPMVLEG